MTPQEELAGCHKILNYRGTTIETAPKDINRSSKILSLKSVSAEWGLPHRRAPTAHGSAPYYYPTIMWRSCVAISQTEMATCRAHHHFESPWYACAWPNISWVMSIEWRSRDSSNRVCAWWVFLEADSGHIMTWRPRGKCTASPTNKLRSWKINRL